MNRGGGASLPSGAAILSGIPQHLLDDAMLAATLRRMGLRPVDRGERRYHGATARWWALDLVGLPMTVIRIVPPAALRPGLSGRYPGSDGDAFPPPEGRVLLLAWDEAALHEPGNVKLVLTTLALLSAFLFPRLIQWRPARLWSHAPDFIRGIEKYLRGSPLPVLHLVGFDRTGDGDGEGGMRIATQGLDAFTGQELAVDATGLGSAETIRRLARLALDMIAHGPVLRGATIDGLAPGERITLTPRPGESRPGVVDVVIGGG